MSISRDDNRAKSQYYDESMLEIPNVKNGFLCKLQKCSYQMNLYICILFKFL